MLKYLYIHQFSNALPDTKKHTSSYCHSGPLPWCCWLSAFLRGIPCAYPSAIAPPGSQDWCCPWDGLQKPSQPLWHISPSLTATPSFQVLSSSTVLWPSHTDHAVSPWLCLSFLTPGAGHVLLWNDAQGLEIAENRCPIVFHSQISRSHGTKRRFWPGLSVSRL